MEASSAPEALDALNRRVATLESEAEQLGARAGEERGAAAAGINGGGGVLGALARAKGDSER
jgi:hypothetical protein